MNLKQLLTQHIQEVQRLGPDLSLNPRKDIEKILEHVFSDNTLNSTDMYIRPESRIISVEENEKFQKIFHRFLNGEPLAYILGYQDFYRHRFMVNPYVLIPRPETELLVEKALELIQKHLLHELLELKNREMLHITDWGTGSGCIGLSLLFEWIRLFPEHLNRVHFTLLDESDMALQVAQQNAMQILSNINSKTPDKLWPFSSLPLSFRNSKVEDEFSISQKFPLQFSHPIHSQLILANPPYVSRNSTEVGKSVSHFEPHRAVFSDQDGFEHILRWSQEAKLFSSHSKETWLIFEVGFDQGQKTMNLWKSLSFSHVKLMKDYQDRDRILIGKIKRRS